MKVADRSLIMARCVERRADGKPWNPALICPVSGGGCIGYFNNRVDWDVCLRVISSVSGIGIPSDTIVNLHVLVLML